jgi:hypothetical protein
MNPNRNRLCRFAATCSVVLLTAGPALAQNPAMCSAFARNPTGGWTVLAPVAIGVQGLVLSPTVGTIFTAGSSIHGVEMTNVLDRECGNISR